MEKKKVGIVILATNAYFVLGVNFMRKFSHHYKGDAKITFYFFSDTDPKFKGIDSTILLTEVYQKVVSKGFKVENLDCTVVLEKPKVNPHIPFMQEIISRILEIDKDAVSIKATTHEQVDSFGESKAIKAYAACLLMG